MYNSNALRRVLASSVVAALAIPSLYANEPTQNQPANCEKKPVVCCPAPQPGPFAFAFPMDRDLNCPRDFFVHVDGLAMQAKQDGMEFVIRDDTSFAERDNFITNGRVRGFSSEDHDWDYNPGMRVGMGFFLGQDVWSIDFNWTWLNITDYEHISSVTPGGTLIPLWLLGKPTLANEFGQNASAVWDASYNTLDIRFAKPYHISRYLVFNPHIGARAAWIDQHFSVDYSGYVGTGAGENRAIHHGDNDFWGIGLRSGLDTNWRLGKGWTLFGNVAGSLLFGQFDVEQSLILPTGGDGFDLDNDMYQNVPNMEIAMGLGWGRFFNKQQYRVDLKLGYEFHVWWDQLNLRRFWSGAPQYANDVVSRGNLTLNGFSLKLQLDM